MATTTGSRYDHIAIQDGSNTTLHYLTDNRYPDVPNDSTKYLRGDGTWNTINVSSPYVAGTGTGSAVLGSVTSVHAANGTGSVAEGVTYAVAKGAYSHAEGIYPLAYGESSHVEGSGSNTNVNISGSNGVYTAATAISTPQFKLYRPIWTSNAVSFITSISDDGLTINTKESLGDLTNCNAIIGGNLAYQKSAHAEGTDTVAYGLYSHAEGDSTHAEGGASHAEGEYTWAYSGYSHAEGMGSETRYAASHAEGYNTLAAGEASHAEGGIDNSESVTLSGSGTQYTISKIYQYYLGKRIAYGNTRSYITQIDINNKTIVVKTTLGTLNKATCNVLCSSSALGKYSHSEGSQTTAQGNGSHAEGTRTTAVGGFSHAEGYDTISNSLYSHAEGQHTTSSGNYSHAEGGYTTSTGPCSHAEGYYAISRGNYSHAEGNYTIASGQYQHTSGQYNVEDLNNTYAEIVGIGTSTSGRKNGRTLDWSGNEQLAGSLTLGLGTTDQTTVTAAQLKQLLNSLPVLVTINSSGEITSHTWQQLHDAYFASRLVLQLNEYSAVSGLVSECGSSSDYYYVTFISLFDSSESRTYDTTSANGYPRFAEPM